MDISDRSDKSLQSRIFRSGHPKVRVRFRMHPSESLMSSGRLLRSEKNGLSRFLGAFLGASLPPSGTTVS